MPVRMQVTVSGAEELMAKLAPELYADELAEGMAELGARAVEVARSVAPVGETGRLRDRLQYRLSDQRPPRFVVVKTDARSPRGYPYPRRLEFERKSRHRNWLLKAMRGALEEFGTLLESVADRVERRWRRG
jgi:hypothetical protein